MEWHNISKLLNNFLASEKRCIKYSTSSGDESAPPVDKRLRQKLHAKICPPYVLEELAGHSDESSKQDQDEFEAMPFHFFTYKEGQYRGEEIPLDESLQRTRQGSSGHLSIESVAPSDSSLVLTTTRQPYCSKAKHNVSNVRPCGNKRPLWCNHLGNSSSELFMGELAVGRGLYGALQSSSQVRKVKCCFKHFLMDSLSCKQDMGNPSQCNNYDDGTALFESKDTYFTWGPDLKVRPNGLALDANMRSRHDQTRSMNENAKANDQVPTNPAIQRELILQAHPAYQHPIIQEVTPLLHAHDFPGIIKRVCPVGKCLSPDIQVPLHFILGLAYFKLADYKEAKLSFNACITQCVNMGTNNQGDIGLCSVYLGDTEFNTQHFIEAATHYRKATQLYSVNNVAELFRMVPPSLSAVHAKCGSALKNASKLVDSVQEYKLAIEKALTDKDKLAANTSLGNLYQSLGENNSALKHYKQSVHLSEILVDYISLGWAHGNMGSAYLGLFQKDRALYHLQKSLDLTVEYEPTPQAIGRTYNNLGTAYQSMGELGKAQEHYDLALSQAIYGNDIPGQARVYGNMGNVLMLQKQYSEAVPHYGEVLRLSKDRSTLSTAHHNRGCAYYKWAETKMEKLPQLKEDTHTSRFYIHGPEFTDPKDLTYPRRVIDSIAEFYRKGEKDLQEVVKYHEENLDDIKGSAKGLSLSISLFETNSRTFHRLQDCQVNLGEYTQALLVAEQSRARTLGELMLKRKGWSLPHPISSPLEIDQIVSTVSARSHPVFYLSFTGARLLGWVFVPVGDSDVKMDMFEVPLRDDQFDGRSFDYHLRYSLAETLVERSFEMYRGVTYDEESSKPVEYLYDLIAKPLLCILEKYLDITDINKIVVISDSYTALLPYSSLRMGSSFLGDKISFQLMPSLLTMSVLDQLPDTNIVRLPADAINMCIVGNPTVPRFIHDGKVRNMGKLPYARKEAEWVAQILKTTPILDEQATKSAILMRIQSAKVIHFATHGSASAGFLAFGAMVSLSGEMMVNSGSVLLYPHDVERMNISPALVVLSSCDSGRGTMKAARAWPGHSSWQGLRQSSPRCGGFQMRVQPSSCSSSTSTWLMGRRARWLYARPSSASVASPSTPSTSTGAATSSRGETCGLKAPPPGPPRSCCSNSDLVQCSLVSRRSRNWRQCW